MSAVAVEPDLRTLGYADKACGVCGWRFFTTAGRYEHEATHFAPPPEPVSPALREAGLRVAALNNSRRCRCDVCGLTSTRPALGFHQKHTGHTGWTEDT